MGLLNEGANAIDAAIAASAMLGVTYPHMAGVGGDVFLLYYEATTGRVHALNGSGAAPREASVDAVRARGLDAIPARGPLSVTVPATVAAWESALVRFGSRRLSELLAPAVAAAADSVPVEPSLAACLARHRDLVSGNPALSALFLRTTGEPLRAGDRLRQPELATTLERIAAGGAEEMYRGALARRIAAASRDADGLLCLDDLRACRIEWVEPISTRYRGLDVLTAPPNSQGLAALLMLNSLTAAGDDRLQPGTAKQIDALVRAKRPAFADRDRFVADPHFAAPPVASLLGAAQARDAVGASAAGGDASAPSLLGDTVCVCVIDGDGNACSLIQSIAYPLGSAWIAGDTGVLMHNRGHYFSSDERAANRLEPGKRPLHTLMPMLVLERGRVGAVLGTMGGEGQPQTNVQVLLRVVARQSPQDAVAAPRVLHGRAFPEDDPELLRVDAALGDDVIDELRSSHERVEVVPVHDEVMGHAQAIVRQTGNDYRAGADPRSDGAAIVVSDVR